MSYKIPLFKLNFDHQEEEAVIETIQSKWISIGPKCDEFEKAFAEALNINFAITLANCTAALHLALLALEIKEGDEVLCPSLSFAASVNCIKYVGATPVFCDIKGPEDINIDPKEIEQKITSKTKAIVVVHLAGYPCDMDEIMGLAKKHNLKVIEDACHGPLSEYKSQKLGTIGDIGCYSFFSNKNMSTGEGGMIVCNDSELAQRIKLLRSHGMTTLSYQRSKGHATSYDIALLGYNYRMDDIRASIGIVQLKKLFQDLKLRQKVRATYLDKLSNIETIYIPFKNSTSFSSNYIMPIVLKNSTKEKRETVRDKLHEAGIQTSVHYPAIHKFSIYKDINANLPKTDYVSDNEITLPMFGSLSTAEIEYIIDNLQHILTE